MSIFKPFMELARKEWADEQRRLYVRGFRLPLVTGRTRTASPGPIDLVAVRISLGFGDLSYVTADLRLEVDEEGTTRFQGTSTGRPVTTEPIGFAVLLTALGSEDNAGENQARRALDECEGILVALGGLGVVQEHLFDNILDPRQDTISAYFGRVLNPGWYRPPDLDLIRLQAPEIDNKLAGLSPNDRNRVTLALRWLTSAARDLGVDSFLKYWIAIETLAMPDTMIKPVEEALCRIYKTTLSKTRERFCIGRIFGLRSAIVHQGLRIDVPGEIGRYLEAVFTDLLLESFGLIAEGRAQQTLTQGSFSVRAWLQAVPPGIAG